MRPAVLSLLLLALPLYAQDADPTAPPTVGADAKALQVVTVSAGPAAAEYWVQNVPKGGYVEWSVSPRTAGDYFRRFKGSSRLIYAGPPGEYVATARVELLRASSDLNGIKKGELIPADREVTELSVRFTLGAPAPVPPGPPPIPPPVDPVDPLAAALKQAAQQDGWPAAKLAALAAAFQTCADTTASGKTVGEITTAHKRTLSAVPLPARVADLIVAELKKLDTVLPPLNPSKLPTNAEIEAVRNVLNRLAAACAGAAR